MQLISNENYNSSKRIYKFYDFQGNITSFNCPLDSNSQPLEEAILDKKQCCYSIESENNNLFFIKQSALTCFDPKQDSITYRKKNWQYQKVTEKIFNFYLKYLETGKEKYIKLAEFK